jgi:uncharacterized protein YndB with AHSA1/START domain
MKKASFTENAEQRTLTVKRTFDAPLDRVWAAWTEQELLEKWWAPQPWKAVTKSFDFREGGQWHYYMEGPEGERHWCLVDYIRIERLKRFTARDVFCDEDGVPNTELPGNDWDNAFNEDGGQTHVVVTLTFVSAEDMKKIIEMGFKEGFSLGLDQLDALLSVD